MANETSEVVTSWTAPARARRVPGSAARATTGSVASSRVTSQEAEVASAGDPDGSAGRGEEQGDGDGGPAGLVGALGRPREQQGDGRGEQGGELERRRQRRGGVEAGAAVRQAEGAQLVAGRRSQRSERPEHADDQRDERDRVVHPLAPGVEDVEDEHDDRPDQRGQGGQQGADVEGDHGPLASTVVPPAGRIAGPTGLLRGTSTVTSVSVAPSSGFGHDAEADHERDERQHHEQLGAVRVVTAGAAWSRADRSGPVLVARPDEAEHAERVGRGQ